MNTREPSKSVAVVLFQFGGPDSLDAIEPFLINLFSDPDYRGWWEKPVHFLIITHLIASVALHLWAIYTQSHDIFGVFPYEYSYFALVYFVFFAWRSWTVRALGGTLAQ